MEKYISRVKAVVNSYDLELDSDLVVEQDFEESVNDAIEEVEALGAEVMTINFSNHLTGLTLVKIADIEFSLTQEQLSVVNGPAVPVLAEGSKKITEAVFNFMHLKSEEGLEPKEIVAIFVDNDQRVSEFTVRKVLSINTFSEYYA